MINIIKGNLIELAKKGEFDVIAHGCNAFCNFGAGIAYTIKNEFPAAFHADLLTKYGDYKKLGNYSEAIISNFEKPFFVLNCYTQYSPGIPSPGLSILLDYEALTLCLRKINYNFPNVKIGLPWIGCGLAKGNKDKVKKIIEESIFDSNVTIVEFN